MERDLRKREREIGRGEEIWSDLNRREIDGEKEGKERSEERKRFEK